MISLPDIRAKEFGLCVVGMGRIGLPLNGEELKNHLDLVIREVKRTREE